MAVRSLNYQSPTVQDTSRQPSATIWGDLAIADWAQLGGMGGSGIFMGDDFCPIASISTAAAIGTVGQWAAWLASGQTIVDGVEEGGVAKLDGGTANKSTILTSNAGAFRFCGGTSAFTITGGKFAMEMRIALGSIAASQQGVFFGLADNTSSQINSPDTTVVASGGNTLTTTKNIIGVFNRTTTGPTEFSAVYQPAAGTAVYPTGLTTLVTTVTGSAMSAWAASTNKGQGTGYVKIGMTFDPTPGNVQLAAPTSTPSGTTAGVVYKPLFQFYVNGVPLPAFLTQGIMQAATFPNNCIFSPVFQYMNIAGATAPVYLDWMYFGQAASF